MTTILLRIFLQVKDFSQTGYYDFIMLILIPLMLGYIIYSGAVKIYKVEPLKRVVLIGLTLVMVYLTPAALSIANSIGRAVLKII